MALSRSAQQADITLSQAGNAESALGTITRSVAVINERNLVIATAAEQQAQAAREVDRNLIRIRDFSGQTADAAAQATVASAQLSVLAINLDALTKRFKL